MHLYVRQETSYPFNIRAYKNEIVIVFNEKLVRYAGTILIDKRYDPLNIVRFFLSLLCLRRGVIMVHGACSAFPDRGFSIMISGYPNAGKTSNLLLSMFLYDAKYVFEDIGFIDERGVPYLNAPVWYINSENKHLLPLINNVFNISNNLVSKMKVFVDLF